MNLQIFLLQSGAVSRFPGGGVASLILLTSIAVPIRAQTSGPGAAERITLEDAIGRAQRYGSQIQSASLAVALAHEDRIQTRAGMLPSLSALNQFIYTQGDGTASGVFVANDGVHVYNEQAMVHEDLLNAVRRADLRRARAAEAVAGAKRDVAVRGLRQTVVQDFYAIVAADRKAESAQTASTEAQRFLDITRKQQQGGEAAQADVLKAELQTSQRARELAEAGLAREKAKIALGVLIFPDVTRDFQAVDDTEAPLAPPSVEDASAIISVSSDPDVSAAIAAVEQAHNEKDVARYSFFPTLALDFFYGIDANQFAAQTNYPTPESGRSTQPDYLVPFRQNLGYSGQVTLNVPMWNWGATRSKVRQAELRETQARADVSFARKQARANLDSATLEFQAAREQASSLQHDVDLAKESLRLTLLRYEGGEATVLEVADAQNTAIAARNALTDGLVRRRVALATLRILTGRF